MTESRAECNATELPIQHDGERIVHGLPSGVGGYSGVASSPGSTLESKQHVLDYRLKAILSLLNTWFCN